MAINIISFPGGRNMVTLIMLIITTIICLVIVVRINLRYLAKEVAEHQENDV
jgi:hypothetical protein